MKQKKLQNTVLLLLMGTFLYTCPIVAQEVKKLEYNTNKWIYSIGTGYSIGKYDGIPPSRNQINYYAQHGLGTPTQDGDGYIVGMLVDIKVQRKFNKNYVGFHFNYYLDSNEGVGRTDQNVQGIKADSLGIPQKDHFKGGETIHTEHSYTNLGISYQRELFKTESGKFTLNAAATMGLSINHTPDRTEYDYFDSNGFIATDTTSDGDVYRLESTHFRNGFFVNPSVNMKYNIFKNQGIMIELSGVYQWHGIEKISGTAGESGKGSMNIDKYFVNATQIKILYFF